MGEEQMADEVLEVHSHEFEPRCFYTGFNGPVDPGFAHVASTPPTL